MLESRDRFTALALLSLAELLAMGLWFGVSAVAPMMASDLALSAQSKSWLTIAVQLGFVAGTLLSAVTNLPDVISPRVLFGASAVVGAAVNALIVFLPLGLGAIIVVRFLTGAMLAGVYPPGMKIVATWFKTGRGLALGTLVGALTLGKASPYLVNAVGSSSWRMNVLVASVLALAGGLVVFFFVEEGPYSYGRAKFDASQVLQLFRVRSVRLANFGYFGHMWELYAMWTWIPAMLRASAAATGTRSVFAEVGAFLVIGSGLIGCIVAGAVADRIGRTTVTSIAMGVSGACCVVVGFTFGAPWVLAVIATVWGATVVADSAQFSACVTELGDPRYVGTALTMQTCIGFLLTTVSIEMIPLLVDAVGWRYAFIALAPGPILGTVAMLRLRSLPDALRLAGGNR